MACGFYDLPALGAQVRRQRGKQFLGVGLRHSQIPNGPAQQFEVFQQVVQHVVLLVGKGVVLPHLVHGLSRDGDGQDGFRPAVVLAVVRVAVRVIYGFHRGGEGCHFPEHLLQPCYPVGIQSDHIHTVIGPRGFHRKHCHDLPPVRRGAVYDNLVVVPGLQFLQLTSVFHIDLGDGRTERHRGTVSRLVGEQDTKGGGD